MAARREQRTYDHRLIRLVQETRDASIATGLGVPRSTVAGWLARAPREVVTAPALCGSAPALRHRVARLERRVARLLAMTRILIALVQVLRIDPRRVRVPEGREKLRLLRAIDRSSPVLGLTRLLGLVGLSPARLSAWRRRALGCDLEDHPSCPSSSPQRLTAEEIAAMRDLATSKSFAHLPTSRLAMLAQRLGVVFASVRPGAAT